MVINLKEKLFDKIGGLNFVNPDEYGAKYNKGVRDSLAKVNSFINNELVPGVPQYVADWYEKHKDDIDFRIWKEIKNRALGSYNNEKINDWIESTEDAIIILVKMHLFGYKVEEEKKYLVKLKGVIDGTKVLKHNMNDDSWYLGISFESKDLKDIHTKEELEAGGFGGVFNNPMFEVEEMKNND